jgi:hypothetical protein
MPKRIEQEAPQTIQDYALLIVYYEGLVKEWEAWGRFIKDNTNLTIRE